MRPLNLVRQVADPIDAANQERLDGECRPLVYAAGDNPGNVGVVKPFTPQFDDPGKPIDCSVGCSVFEDRMGVAPDDFYIALRAEPLHRFEVALQAVVDPLSDVERGIAPCGVD